MHSNSKLLTATKILPLLPFIIAGMLKTHDFLGASKEQNQITASGTLFENYLLFEFIFKNIDLNSKFILLKFDSDFLDGKFKHYFI